jgi:excisionase family DNA binding protein
MANETTSKLLSRAEVAEMLGVEVSTLEAWANRGKPALRYFKIGRLAKYRLDDVEKFVESRCGTSATEIAAALA